MTTRRWKHILWKHTAALALILLLCLWGCPIYRFIGFPCPCCGTTRAWLFFLRGEFASAFRTQALFLLIPLMLLAACHRRVWISAIGADSPVRTKKAATAIDLFLIASAVAVFGYYLLRVMGVGKLILPF